jgi:hypothetical protein
MAQGNRIFIGIQGAVLAIDRATGEVLWRTDVKGSDFVTVAVNEGDVFAASRGRLYRLDPATGDLVWVNELKGLGYGIVSIAGDAQVSSATSEQRRREKQAAAVVAT